MDDRPALFRANRTSVCGQRRQEILVINPRNNRIEQRWKPLGDKPALLLNIAEDSRTGRLFVTDNSKRNHSGAGYSWQQVIKAA